MSPLPTIMIAMMMCFFFSSLWLKTFFPHSFCKLVASLSSIENVILTRMEDTGWETEEETTRERQLTRWRREWKEEKGLSCVIQTASSPFPDVYTYRLNYLAPFVKQRKRIESLISFLLYRVSFSLVFPSLSLLMFSACFFQRLDLSPLFDKNRVISCLSLAEWYRTSTDTASVGGRRMLIRFLHYHTNWRDEVREEWHESLHNEMPWENKRGGWDEMRKSLFSFIHTYQLKPSIRWGGNKSSESRWKEDE